MGSTSALWLQTNQAAISPDGKTVLQGLGNGHVSVRFLTENKIEFLNEKKTEYDEQQETEENENKTSENENMSMHP